MPVDLNTARVRPRHVVTAPSLTASSATTTAKPTGTAALRRSNVMPPPASVDPPFLPAGFDMDASVAGLKALLVAQGVSPDSLAPGKAVHTVTTDFDGTLGRSGNIPVFLRAKADVTDASGAVIMKAGDFFQDEHGNDLMIHGLTGADVGNDMKLLTGKFPNLPWASVTQDWSAWDDRALAMKTPLETKMVRRIKDAAKATEPTASFIITARTNAVIAGGMHEALRARGTDVTGVIATGDASVQKQLGVDDPKLSDGQRKALVQMIIMTMYGGAAMKSHSFFDDSPGNDAASIGSLAAKFPTVDLKIYTADHVVGKSHSTPRLVAHSNGQGQFTDVKDGTVFTPDKIAALASTPLPQLPMMTPDEVADG